MIEILQRLPFFITDVKEHVKLKKRLIENFDAMGTFSYIDVAQKISNTDWHLGSGFSRPYYDLVQPIFQSVCKDIQKKMHYPDPLDVTNYWYQKYNQGDSHKWHVHKNSNFSSVYYVSLPEGSAKTTFKVLGEEFSVDVKEGQILSFPGMVPHCSKPNLSEEPKIIISFNC
jgi:mannose-6-phosphate isomerase-like protein (cupin superfamily)